MKLVAVILHHALSTPGLRLSNNGQVEPGKGVLIGWDIHVRGPRVLLRSPVGWIPGQPKGQWNAPGRTVFDIPREHVTLQWGECTDADVDQVTKWSPVPEVQTSASKRELATVEPVEASAGDPDAFKPEPKAQKGAGK